MAQSPINNRQASLALNEYFPLNAAFPPNGSGGIGFFLGMIGTYAGTINPSDALASGQLLAIAQNTAVFSLLGTTYGGNGQTNFALPNLQGNAPMHIGGAQPGPGLSIRDLGENGGEEFVTLIQTEMPIHAH